MNDVVTSYRNIIDMQNDALRRSRARIGLPTIAVSLLPGWQIGDDFQSGVLVPGMQLQVLFPGWGIGIGAVTGRAYE